MKITAEKRVWQLSAPFRISRGTKRQAAVVQASVAADGIVGRGEAVAYPRYGENAARSVAQLRAFGAKATQPLTHEHLLETLKPGGARNALDAALWDWRAQKLGTPVWELAGVPRPVPLVSAWTLSLEAPDVMARHARARGAAAVLKLKLGNDIKVDMERLAAVRAARKDARLVVDANEGWQATDVWAHADALQAAKLEVLEQPVPRGQDKALAGFPVPLCADESFLREADLDHVAKIYTYANLKLDKAGGLTAALAQAKAVRARGLKLMLGCMVASSRGLAPAFALAAQADIPDLDGALFILGDYANGITLKGGLLHPPQKNFWGDYDAPHATR